MIWHRIWYNDTVIKTTVYFDEDLALTVRQIAQAEGRAQADLIRDAVAQYVARARRPRSTGIGAYHSGRTDVAERAEELFGELVHEQRWQSS